MSHPKFILLFDATAVRSVGRRPAQDGTIGAVITLRNQKPETMRSIARTFAEASNELFDAVDKMETNETPR